MDSIYRLVTDPAWWFTAIFIGLIIAVVGGLITTPLQRWFGTVFTGYKSRAAASRAEREALIKAFSENATFLVIGFIRVIGQVVLIVGMMTLAGLLTIRMRMPPEPSQLLSPEIVTFMNDMLFPGLLLAAIIWTTYRFTKRIRILNEAYQIYRRAHGWPRIP